MRSIPSLLFKALLPLVGMFALGVFFYQEVVNSILFTPHPAIVFIIFGLLGLGAFLLVLNLRQLVREQQQFDAVRNLDADQRPEALRQLVQTDNRFRAVASLLVLSDGVDRQAQQEACEAEMHRVQVAFNEALSFPNFLSGALVGLGLVGTFIGLLGALGDIAELIAGLSIMGSQSGNMIELFARLVQQLQNPMKSMATAFVASLYGLLGSMVLGFMQIAQRKFTPAIIDQWRSLVSEMSLIELPSDIPEGATQVEMALTEARQWKQLFSQLRAEHTQLIDSDLLIQKRLGLFIQQSQDQHQELLERYDARMQEWMERSESQQRALIKSGNRLLNSAMEQNDARQQALQEHTQQQVLVIQAESRELARVLHERNETDALVRRALGEGQHWMQTLMQLQETASQFVRQQQQQSTLEVAATQSASEALRQLTERLQRSESRQEQDLQRLTQEMQRLVEHTLQLEGTARQLSTAVLQTVDNHQQALQDSTHKLRDLLAFELNERASTTSAGVR